MKKFASLCASFAFLMLVTAPAFAADAPAAALEISGSVTKVDGKAMSLNLKDDKGAEKTIFWNADTKVMLKDGKAGKAEDIKQDGMLKAKTMEKDGKVWATEIWLQ